MGEPFIGSEAVAQGLVTKSALRSRYTRLHPDVYIDPNREITPTVRAAAAWLWSRRRAVIAGRSAAAMHGADEVTLVGDIPITSVIRTALDIACWNERLSAITTLDALARATAFATADVLALAERYPGRRGIARARAALPLADGGAQSPKETWLRLLLIDAGLPRPETQIDVPIPYSSKCYSLDMGWRHLAIAVEYDGEQHRTSRSQYSWDVRRHENLRRQGWIVIRVLADDKPADIVRRVRHAFAERGFALR